MTFKFPEIKKLETFIWIKETKRGIETYSNENIKDLNKPIKAQIRAFLTQILKEV